MPRRLALPKQQITFTIRVIHRPYPFVYQFRARPITMSSAIPLSSLPTISDLYRNETIQPGAASESRPQASASINAKVSLIRTSITSLATTCIVNAANESLLGGGGVVSQIYKPPPSSKSHTDCVGRRHSRCRGPGSTQRMPNAERLPYWLREDNLWLRPPLEIRDPCRRANILACNKAIFRPPCSTAKKLLQHFVGISGRRRRERSVQLFEYGSLWLSARRGGGGGMRDCKRVFGGHGREKARESRLLLF